MCLYRCVAAMLVLLIDSWGLALQPRSAKPANALTDCEVVMRVAAVLMGVSSMDEQSCLMCVCAGPGITGVAGEQLLQSPQGPQHKQQPHMLHTQQSVQQRNSIQSLSRDSLHIRDRDVHSQQPQQQQQHSVEGGGSSHKGTVSKGGGKFKRRGVVADVCWMLRIKTFQVGQQLGQQV